MKDILPQGAEGQPTLQARRALMSGRRTFPWKDDRIIPGDRLNLQPGWQPLNEDDYTITEILRDSSYWTGFITDVAQYFKPGMNFHRGFDTYDFVRGQSCDFYRSSAFSFPKLPDNRISASKLRNSRGARYEAVTRTFRSEEDYFAAQVYGKAAQWILEHRNVEKIFLWADAFDPHEPWTPPDAYQDLYTREELLSEPYALSQHPACQSEDANCHSWCSLFPQLWRTSAFGGNRCGQWQTQTFVRQAEIVFCPHQ